MDTPTRAMNGARWAGCSSLGPAPEQIQRNWPGCLLPAGLLGGAELATVILAQRFLLAVAEVLAAFDVRGVLDLVLGHGKHDEFAVELRSADRREAVPGAEQAGLYQHPLWLAGLLVEEHLADLADPVALGIDRGAVDVVRKILRGGHGCLPKAGAGHAVPGLLGSYQAGRATRRRRSQTALKSRGRGGRAAMR